jgi:hypothetical protein
MKYFTYDQNNSGGSFSDYLWVIVEAPSSPVADSLACDFGPCYFDGCDEGMDCDCCGDRWHRAWSDSGYDTLEAAEAAAYTDHDWFWHQSNTSEPVGCLIRSTGEKVDYYWNDRAERPAPLRIIEQKSLTSGSD